MKRKLTLLLSLIVPLLAHSATVYVNGLKYDTDTSTLTSTLTGYEGEEKPTGELIIPAAITVNNVKYAVTSIGSSAFYGCRDLTGNLTIPNSVTSIDDRAFLGCRGFTGNLTIGNSVTSIDDYAFYWCCGLTGNLTIPNSVTSIGDEAFIGCEGFTGNLTIGNSVTSIGDEAFNGCCTLTGTLTIPNSVTSIGSYAFENCKGLTNIVVDTNNDYYSSLDGVLFNNDFTEIICYPVRKSEIEHQYSIPNSVTHIASSAFCGCSGFTGTLTIPKSVTSIGDYAFDGCSGLTGNLTIPNSVTSIGEYAFSGCSGFTGNLTIGNSVTHIASYAFKDCWGFSKIICNATTPPSCGFLCFYVNTETCVLAVPTGTLMSYFSAPVWGTFINIVEDSSLAVADNLADEVKVAVVSNTLIISNAVNVASVAVYDLNGTMVAVGSVIDGAAQIELPAANGIYIVTIANRSYKVIK